MKRQLAKIRTYYWRERHWVKNLGDYLAPLLIEALGYRSITRQQPGQDAVNAGRCLLPIGSVITNGHLKLIGKAVDVWGCGWNGDRVQRKHLVHVTFHAVRGPVPSANLLLPLIFLSVTPVYCCPTYPLVLWHVMGERLWCPIIIEPIR